MVNPPSESHPPSGSGPGSSIGSGGSSDPSSSSGSRPGKTPRPFRGVSKTRIDRPGDLSSGGPGAPVALFPEGTRLADRYVVVRLLGQGGIGAVYQVRDENFEGEEIALKVLHPGSDLNPKLLELFQDEARITRKLSHTNILRSFDIVRHGDLLAISMELLEGVTMRQWMSVEKTAPDFRERALEYLLQVCDGLAEAHRFTVHRDLKPENLFITNEGVVKITDFGIAKILQAGHDPEQPSLTGPLGTMQYAAPEQTRIGAPVDARADLFSLGAVTYEVLCGEPPVGRFPLPTEVDPRLPSLFDDLVESALHPSPEKRPANVATFRQRLTDGLDQLTGASAPATETGQATAGPIETSPPFAPEAKNAEEPSQVSPATDSASTETPTSSPAANTPPASPSAVTPPLSAPKDGVAAEPPPARKKTSPVPVLLGLLILIGALGGGLYYLYLQGELERFDLPFLSLDDRSDDQAPPAEASPTEDELSGDEYAGGELTGEETSGEELARGVSSAGVSSEAMTASAETSQPGTAKATELAEQPASESEKHIVAESFDDIPDQVIPAEREVWDEEWQPAIDPLAAEAAKRYGTTPPVADRSAEPPAQTLPVPEPPNPAPSVEPLPTPPPALGAVLLDPRAGGQPLSPEAVRLTLDGEPLDWPPGARLELPPGRYILEATLPEHQPWRESVLIRAGEEPLLAIRFQPLPGLLRLTNLPAGAILRGPGFTREISSSEAVLELEAAPGEGIEVTLEAPGFEPLTRILSVDQPGETLTVDSWPLTAIPPEETTSPPMSGSAIPAAGRPLLMLRDARKAELDEDWPEAIRLYGKASESGSLPATVRLREIIQTQRGLPADALEALPWHQAAAERNYGPSLFALGQAAEKGLREAPDMAAARTLYRRAAEANSAEAMLRLGQLAAEASPPDYPVAARWFRRAAENGLPEGAYELGQALEQGHVPNVDDALAKAAQAYRRAAESGYAPAQERWAHFLENGLRVPRNDREARRHYLMAADAGIPAAQARAGHFLRHGIGGPPEPARAGGYLEQAAHNGDAEAAFTLAEMYEKAEIPGGLEPTLRWYRMALTLGHPQAASALNSLGPR